MLTRLNFLSHRTLVWRVAKREIEARFRGSFLGLFWAVIAPLFMLAVYSLVFGSIFGARWATPKAVTTAQEFGFPMMLFLGLIVFNVFAEMINRAPGIVLENISYVKKVLFPLEILPIVALLSALITASISFAIFIVAFIALYGPPPPTIFLLPVVILPICMMALALSYFLGALGVFIRDLRHITPLATTGLMFMSSLFYDVSSLPDAMNFWIQLNPLTSAITEARNVSFWGIMPNLTEYIIWLLVSFLALVASFYWYVKAEKAFADVV